MSGVTGSLDRYEKHAVPYSRDKTELEFHGKFSECWKHLTGMCWCSWQWMERGFGDGVCVCLLEELKGGWTDISDKSSTNTRHNLSVAVWACMTGTESNNHPLKHSLYLPLCHSKPSSWCDWILHYNLIAMIKCTDRYSKTNYIKLL